MADELCEVKQFRLQQTWHYSRLSKTKFKRLYIPLIKNTADLIQSSSLSLYQGREYTFIGYLQQLLMLLKGRVGIILPLDAFPEDISRLADRYSYALIAAFSVEIAMATAYQDRSCSTVCCRRSSGGVTGSGGKVLATGEIKALDDSLLMLAHRVIPKEGIDWLLEEQYTAKDFCEYFTCPENNILHKIKRATFREKLHNGRAKYSPSSVPESLATGKGKAKANAKPTTSGGYTVNTAAPRNRVGSDNRPSAKTRELDSGDKLNSAAGWKFVTAISSAIRLGEIRANDDSGWLFTDAIGRVFLKIPDAFDWYESKSGVASSTAKNQFNRLRLSTRREGSKDIHLAHQAMDSKQRMQGLVVEKVDLFFQGRPPLGSLIIQKQSNG